MSDTVRANSQPATENSPPAAAAQALPSPNSQLATDNSQLTSAIANWDCVPEQLFAGDLNVGVVAFHASGIDRVDFTASPGLSPGPSQSPIGISQSTLNPQTGIIEYWCSIAASDFADGPITINAMAYPISGSPKQLAPLTLFANSKNTVAAQSVTVSSAADLLLQLQKIGDGGTVYLAPGKYEIPSTPGANRENKYWITIAKAQGLALGVPGDVIITAAPGASRIILHVSKLRFSNVTIDAGNGYLSGVDFVWLDHCTLTYSGAWLPAPAADPGQPLRTNTLGPNGNYQLYVTDSIATQTIYGFVNAALVRNCTIHEISGDALQRSSLVLNAGVYDFAGTLVHHADVYQMWGDMDNVIVYGLKTWNTSGAQGLFLQPQIPASSLPTAGALPATLSNSAFVNIEMAPNDADGKGGPPFSQLQSRFRNVFFNNWQTPDQLILFRTDGTGLCAFDAQNVLFCNCSFHPLQSKTPPTGVVFENCTNGISAKLNWVGLQ
jgi:hypothetical protein